MSVLASDDCGATCSTAPCASVEALALSIPKKNSTAPSKFAKAKAAMGEQQATVEQAATAA